ncbi:MAG: hypothetical protein ACI83W_002496, partial [Marinoscillum sp.]
PADLYILGLTKIRLKTTFYQFCAQSAAVGF